MLYNQYNGLESSIKNDINPIDIINNVLIIIAKTEVIDVLGCGKVVLVAETGGEYYAFKAFRLSQDYTNGKTQGIVEAGTINYLFYEAVYLRYPKFRCMIIECRRLINIHF